jgi:transposase-like protein
MEGTMAKKRRLYSAQTKARVALEALQERKTVAQIASEFETGPTNVTKWKQVATARLYEIFQTAGTTDNAKQMDSLYEQIGRLQVEVTWLKKNERLLVD